MGLSPLGSNGVHDTEQIVALRCRISGKKRFRNPTGTVPFLTNDLVAEARNSVVVKNWNPRRRAKMGLSPLGSNGVHDPEQIVALRCRISGKMRFRNPTGTVPFLTNDPVTEARNSAVVKNWYSPLARRRFSELTLTRSFGRVA